jgi:hypothetical protein
MGPVETETLPEEGGAFFGAVAVWREDEALADARPDEVVD